MERVKDDIMKETVFIESNVETGPPGICPGKVGCQMKTQVEKHLKVGRSKHLLTTSSPVAIRSRRDRLYSIPKARTSLFKRLKSYVIENLIMLLC